MLTVRPQGPARLKAAAIGLLTVPVAVLFAFTVGEMASGDLSGAQHLLQVAPLLVVLALAWRHPYAAGVALLGMGALLFLAWLAMAVTNLHPVTIAVAALMLFAPPLAAGALLVAAGRRGR